MTLRALALVVVACAACASPDTEPSLSMVTPPWGPLSGGTTVALSGAHFDPDVNRVFVGGREAPVTRTIDDNRLEIVVPPGERAGDAEILVVTSQANVIATGVFSYSDAPVIDSVTPASVLPAIIPVEVSIHGRGFLDEDAGVPVVLVDGIPIIDVVVRSDTLLTFGATPGIPFTRSQIDVINQRGSTSAPGYVHAIADRPGLLIFNLFTDSFATFYEPVEGVITAVPNLPTTRSCIYGVVSDGAGNFLASDYCSFNEYAFGRIDLATQQTVDGVVTGRLYPAIVRHGGQLFAIEYPTDRFGILSPAGDSFSQLGTTLSQCCDVGLASDGATMWVVAYDGGPAIRTIDPATGTTGPSVLLAPPTSITDLRWFAGTIYGTTTTGNLVTINPTTGAVTTVVFVGNAYALEVLE